MLRRTVFLAMVELVVLASSTPQIVFASAGRLAEPGLPNVQRPDERVAEQAAIDELTIAALGAAEAADDAAKRAVDDAAALVKAKTVALKTAEAERGWSLRQYQEAAQEAELREWEASPAAPAAAARSSPEGFMLPTVGWQSSAYGMRFDPFFEVWQLHAGVDIAAPGGAPIYAVRDGTVSNAGWNGGYGNYTCLGHGQYHGQRLSTCYAHQSEILVWEGQAVHRGDLIGRVGTTGASTGDHLHFEVRLDGSPTDPIPFLPPF